MFWIIQYDGQRLCIVCLSLKSELCRVSFTVLAEHAMLGLKLRVRVTTAGTTEIFELVVEYLKMS